ncbi:uncharacterized protein LOC111634227 isoform X1 [Centruroides sculpturatus]|uniref:uncharacterized protein LOC111634227 isoform X1 n=1 Tax=Centruroides sculpturatus TaxID=218467 RepID=UPI000C6D7AE8|nr:uncharacterized protein LOC111634227 isoform X1 [Centruroides sculpturatus]
MINGKLFVIVCCVIFIIVTEEDEKESFCMEICENKMDSVFCLFSGFTDDILDILYDCALPFIPNNSNYFAIYYIFFSGDVDIYPIYVDCVLSNFTDEQIDHVLNVGQDCLVKYNVTHFP